MKADRPEAAEVEVDAAESVDIEEFKAAFRYHPAGVAVITADTGDGPVALTATSVFSISAVPPVLGFSISALSSSTPTIRAADTVVVHLLSAEQLPLAQLASTSGIDRFADTALWSRLETGEPYFVDADTWIRGRIVSQMQVGGSTVVAVHAMQTNLAGASQGSAGGRRESPLVYHDRTWHRLGAHSRL